MSLINRMLQDLETRRAPLDAGHGLGREVRALPPPRKSPVPALLLILTVCVLLVAGAAGWWFKSAATTTTTAPVPLPAPPAVPVPAEPSTPLTVTPANAAIDTPPAVTSGSPSAAVEATPAPTPAPAPAPASVTAASGAAPADPPRETARQALSAEMPKTLPKTGKPDSALHLKVSPLLQGRAVQPETAAVEQTASDENGRIEKKIRPTTARERAEYEYRRALGLVNQGRLQEAMNALRGALAEDAGHAASRLALFGLFVEQQRLDEAQTLLQEALARDAAQPQFAARLARLQMERGDARAAQETLVRAAASASGDAEYHALHAAVLQRLTLHKEAITQYQAALRLAPQAGVWWMGLGISLEATGRAAEAREAFERARATGRLTPELDTFVERKLKSLP